MNRYELRPQNAKNFKYLPFWAFELFCTLSMFDIYPMIPIYTALQYFVLQALIMGPFIGQQAAHA